MSAPVATYRLQLRPEFDFAAAEGVVDYVAELGVSHLYLSPIFAAAPGSSHGYDCVNMNAINPELGGEEAFRALSQSARDAGLGILQDIVPNHRAFSGQNPLLMDVLEKGPDSRFRNFFDIHWEHPYENIRGKVLAPFLGDFYGQVLERGELRIEWEQRGFRLRYWDHSYPLRAQSYATILAQNLPALRRRLGSQHPAYTRLMGVIHFFQNIRAEIDSASRIDVVDHLKKLLWEMSQEFPEVLEHINAGLESINGRAGDAGSFDQLDAIIGEQFYRPSYWKVGSEELNYRRFFSINDLISLRVEDEEVFRFTHQLTFSLLREGIIDGLRIDHLDGLYIPLVYIQRIREEFPDAYLVVEKILEVGERLPAWPLHGTTGYDFLAHVNGLFVQKSNEEAIDRVYQDFTRQVQPYAEMVLEKKRAIIGKSMAGDIDNLALMLKDIASHYRFGADLTLYSLRRALVEVLAQFPVYRTYATEEDFNEEDRRRLEEVLNSCQQSFPILRNELELLKNHLLPGRAIPEGSPEEAPWRRLLLRLQQYTGPVMAKGCEDTAFYVYNRLLSLNEVGASPEHFGVEVEDFHQFCRERREKWPDTMNGSTTHDTKRGEDTRARISVLSEIPEEWAACVERWHGMNLASKRMTGRREWPSLNDEYALYQAMLGSAPVEGLEADDFPQRLEEFAIKAARESKVVTSWLNPHADYEEATRAFVKGILANPEFTVDFAGFLSRVQFFGALNSLSQQAIKLTAPGVPDIYQGSELWDLSMVDPDNRRPVDFESRRRMIARLNAIDGDGGPGSGLPDAIRQIAAGWSDGLIKLHLTRTLLGHRAENPDLYARGAYTPLLAEGDGAESVVAFSRTQGDRTVIVIALRLLANRVDALALPMDLAAALGETTLPDLSQGRPATSLLTGERLGLTARVADLMSGLPVAVLELQ